MEGLDLKYQAAKKAIFSLDKLIAAIEKNRNVGHMPFIDIEEDYKILRESLIQRFEYSVDTLWKYCKEYLLSVKGVKHDSSKPIFRACFVVGLVTEAQSEALVDMIDDRNLTSHMYNEALAERIAKNIPEYCKLMKILLSAASRESGI